MEVLTSEKTLKFYTMNCYDTSNRVYVGEVDFRELENYSLVHPEV